jgi:hypothetical protein
MFAKKGLFFWLRTLTWGAKLPFLNQASSFLKIGQELKGEELSLW